MIKLETIRAVVEAFEYCPNFSYSLPWEFQDDGHKIQEALTALKKELADMDMNRKRPPKDCDDLGLWLSGTINDAIRDAREAGLKSRTAAVIALSLARSAANGAFMTPAEIEEVIDIGLTQRVRELREEVVRLRKELAEYRNDTR